VVAEGRITTTDQAVQALRAGAWTVVVGGAITRPAAITARFADALAAAQPAAAEPSHGEPSAAATPSTVQPAAEALEVQR
jgi:hypothetical protein